MTHNNESRHFVRELPYDLHALEPQISAETLEFHHGKHYAGYVAKLNELLLDSPFAEAPLAEIVRSADGPLFNNAAQAWNHEFYFEALSPDPQVEPSDSLARAIERDFGSLEELRQRMSRAAAALFGSGWVWLSRDRNGELRITSESNAGNPIRQGLRPLLCIDVWEHAYYIDYRNRRPDAVEAHWQRIDWAVVSRRFEW